MDQIAAIITAIGGAAVGILGTILVNARKMRRLRAQSENSHLETFYKTVNEMMQAQEQRHAAAIQRVQDEQREERKLGVEGRRMFDAKIEKLQDELRESIAQGHAKDVLIAQLNGKLELFQSRLDAYSDTHSASKNVTIKA